MRKYPINKEFFPYSRIAPPIQNAKIAGWMGAMMKPPGWIRRDKEVSLRQEMIPGHKGDTIEVLVFTPQGIKEPAPCLLYCHGGGFFFGGAGYHYKLVKQYALHTPCKVVFVQYRLAPKHPHPIPAEDVYAALVWTFANADRLHIDKTKIGVGGDSAGGALAAAACQMARDRGSDLPCFQLLVYPVTDRRMQTESCRQYTDTPMWNSKLSVKMWQGYVPDNDPPDIAYASPMEAESFAGLPSAYVETAEFDCLRDEGTAYAEVLRAAGVPVELNETKGTMHGFDIVEKAPTAKMAAARRIRFMQTAFYGAEKMNQKGENPMKRVCEFLKNAGVYYLATVEGDQPRVRPFGTAHMFEGKLYIQTGKVKPTSKQLMANPKAEVCAFKDGAWLRVAGELIEDDRVEARRSMLDAYPDLRAMYDESDGNAQVFYFKNAVATFCAFGKEPEVVVL